MSVVTNNNITMFTTVALKKKYIFPFITTSAASSQITWTRNLNVIYYTAKDVATIFMSKNNII